MRNNSLENQLTIKVVRNDITEMEADVIVNSANTNYTKGPGMDAAILKKAGEWYVLEERRKFPKLNPGDMVKTSGYNLKAKEIYHVRGPYSNADEEEQKQVLSDCYRKCLSTAFRTKWCSSIAIPMVGAGNLKVRETLSFDTALEVFESFKKNNLGIEKPLTVYLVIIGDKLAKYAREKGFEVEEVITGEQEEKMLNLEKELVKGDAPWQPEELSETKESKPFLTNLKKIMKEYNGSPKKVARLCNLNEGSFKNILSGANKNAPEKETILAICVGLQLPLRDSLSLLASAGYYLGLNNNNKYDNMVVEAIKCHTDIYTLNEALENAGYRCLGAKQGGKSEQTKSKENKRRADKGRD